MRYCVVIALFIANAILAFAGPQNTHYHGVVLREFAVPKVFSCPSAYGQYPHEKYCNLYYECHEYTAYVFECPHDWLFNIHLMLCDLPENVDCGDLEISTSGPPTIEPPQTTESRWPESTTRESHWTTDEEPSTTTERGKTTPSTTSEPFSCPKPNGLFPNPDDCGSYFSCSNGFPNLMHCPGGTNFNPATEQCENGNEFCTGPVGGSTRDPYATTTPPPYDCSVDGVYPNPADCSTYYLCFAGTPILMECPPGTNFNPSTSACEFGTDFCATFFQVKAKRMMVASTETSMEPTEESTTGYPMVTPSPWFECPESEGYFVSPYNCSVYFHCTNNLPWQSVCPGGLWFDLEDKECNWPSEVDCTATPTGRIARFEGLVPDDILAEMMAAGSSTPEISTQGPVASTTTFVSTNVATDEMTASGTTNSPPVTPVNWFKCPGPGLYPNPYDCHTYINCVNGNPWLLQCPSNFIFDEDKDKCVPPGEATCKEISGEPTAVPTEPVFTVDPTFVCPSADGLFPYEQNCHYYYQCANSFPYLQRCSADLIFDPVKKRCSNIADVDPAQLTCDLFKAEHIKFMEAKREKSRKQIPVRIHPLFRPYPKFPSQGLQARWRNHEIKYPSRPLYRASANHGGSQTRPRRKL